MLFRGWIVALDFGVVGAVRGVRVGEKMFRVDRVLILGVGLERYWG